MKFFVVGTKFISYSLHTTLLETYKNFLPEFVKVENLMSHRGDFKAKHTKIVDWKRVWDNLA